jgi:hypothetical protein
MEAGVRKGVRVRLVATAAGLALVYAACGGNVVVDPGEAGTGGARPSSSSAFATSSATTASSSSGATSVTSSSSSVASSSGCPPPPLALIDNMEADTGQILMQQGRSGAWFTYNDATAGAVQSPMPGGACLPDLIPGGTACDRLAAHTFGGGFSTWGAGMGFLLRDTKPYDASMYKGIKFSARGASTFVRVNIPTSATEAVAYGGTCVQQCEDHFGMDITPTSAWQGFTIPFADLGQLGWGAPARFDPKAVIAVEFLISPTPKFDVWIDVVSFY